MRGECLCNETAFSLSDIDCVNANVFVCVCVCDCS